MEFLEMASSVQEAITLLSQIPGLASLPETVRSAQSNRAHRCFAAQNTFFFDHYLTWSTHLPRPQDTTQLYTFKIM